MSQRVYSYAKDQVQDILQMLHMDNEDTVHKCVDIFIHIYWIRRRGFRRSEYKERVALAVSIIKQLVRQRMPRPPLHLAHLCGLTSLSPVLRPEVVLNFSAQEEVGEDRH